MSKPPVDRKLYKIGMITETLGITPRTIRFYDQMGLLPSVKRSHGNTRLFSEEDLQLLKKIIHLQQKEFLPLSEIKKRLFGETDVQTLWVVTDESAVLPAKTAHYSKSTEPTAEAFEAAYLALAKKGLTHVFSLHPSALSSGSYQAAKSAAEKVSKKIKVEVVDTLSDGLGVGLLAYRLSHMIEEGASFETISLLIGKEVPLLQMMVVTDHLDSLVSSKAAPKTIAAQFHAGISKLCPLLILNHGQLTVAGAHLTFESVLQHLFACLDQEYVVRGGYIGTIFIAHHGLFAQATYVVNECKKRFPKTDLVFQEDTVYLNSTFGDKVIALALL